MDISWCVSLFFFSSFFSAKEKLRRFLPLLPRKKAHLSVYPFYNFGCLELC